jgi:hypothetical protein
MNKNRGPGSEFSAEHRECVAFRRQGDQPFQRPQCSEAYGEQPVFLANYNLVQILVKPRSSMRQCQETSGIKPVGQLLHGRMRESIVCAGNPASVPARIRRETHEVEPVSENEAETQRSGEEASEDHAGTYPIGAAGESSDGTEITC